MKNHVDKAAPPRRNTYAIEADPGLGKAAYSDKYLASTFTQPLAKKGELSRNTWADTAYVLVLRAKRAAQSYGKKDFNALYRLVLSAGIAFDKAWPTQLPQPTHNYVVQLFGALPQVKVRSILAPPVPAITTDVSNATDIVELPGPSGPSENT